MVVLDGVEYDKDELIDDGMEAYFIWETDTRSRWLNLETCPSMGSTIGESTYKTGCII